MLMLRLQRMGKTKRPTYRLIVSPKHKDTQAGQLEILGNYDPVQKNKVINFNKERIEYWLSVGAQPSPTVNNLLVEAGIVTGKKQRSVFFTTKRTKKINDAKAKEEQAKADAKAKAEAEKEAAAKAKAEAEEKAKAEAEAAKAAAEAPVTEAPAVEAAPAEEQPAA